MFVVNDDLSIYATRGDIVFFNVTAKDEVTGDPFTFSPTDVLQISIYGKKKCENVVLQKEFTIPEEAQQVSIYLTGDEMKIGGVISRPVDYWYEIVLNPFTYPQTIIGYDDSGAKVFRLFPEGELPEDTEIPEEEIAYVDGELDLTSERPIQNQAVAKEILFLRGELERLSSLISGGNEEVSE